MKKLILVLLMGGVATMWAADRQQEQVRSELLSAIYNGDASKIREIVNDNKGTVEAVFLDDIQINLIEYALSLNAPNKGVIGELLNAQCPVTPAAITRAQELTQLEQGPSAADVIVQLHTPQDEGGETPRAVASGIYTFPQWQHILTLLQNRITDESFSE